ncbi:riboflavin-binding protein-like [Megalops cyprinoides]|uniref:riboflavin-binding protein-like n=1 Tax=Megalops cyprinoides TaxID=118141 RepID=UPI0018648C45|nr:riboflavin-binding protein-like [Megalops cyprinoides]
MGGTKDSMPLVVAYFSAALIGGAWCWGGACLQDSRHKATPGPEPYLTECTLYADNSCCSEEGIQEIVATPAIRGGSVPWDRCGPHSLSCEGFLKRLSCFHRCSPDAARWPHPQQPDAIQATPLCHSFCRDWFGACKADLTCTRDWARDWKGVNCTGSCVPFQQMFRDGRDLCDRLWGDSFVTVEDDGEERGSCGCLSLSPSDREVVAALRAHDEDPDELDTTKTGLPQYRAPCPMRRRAQVHTAPPQARRSNDNIVVHRRSIVMDDAEGSGSGF